MVRASKQRAIAGTVTNYMKVNSFLLLAFWLGMVCSCNTQDSGAKAPESEEEYSWSLEQAKKHAADYNNPETWIQETLMMEIENLSLYPQDDVPLHTSPFPTPKYDSPGNGNGPLEIEIGGKKIVGHNVIIGRGPHSEHLFKNEGDKFISYFSIITISDGLGTPNPVHASSRNHPHYFSQGSLNTSSKNRVDWIAVQLADKGALAIVNGRTFDLRVGRLIMVAPQKDGSIRFYQKDAPCMNSNELDYYLQDLKEDKHVIGFFAQAGNI